MDTELIQLLLPMTIISLACVVQGITGFGAGLVSMSLLPLIWTIPQAVGILSPIGVILTIMLSYKLRSHVQFDKIKPMFFALPFGILLGLWLLIHWPNTWMKAILGFILVVYVLSSKRLTHTKMSEHPVPAACAGFLGGVFSSAVGAAGPPILIYATALGWERDHFRANIQVFFMGSAISTFIGLISQGLINADTLPISALCVPGMVVGGLVGNRLASHLPQEKFRQLVMMGLLAMGVLYLGQWLLS
jgi:uncharacterized membrane protein YfcA